MFWQWIDHFYVDFFFSNEAEQSPFPATKHHLWRPRSSGFFFSSHQIPFSRRHLNIHLLDTQIGQQTTILYLLCTVQRFHTFNACVACCFFFVRMNNWNKFKTKIKLTINSLEWLDLLFRRQHIFASILQNEIGLIHSRLEKLINHLKKKLKNFQWISLRRANILPRCGSSLRDWSNFWSWASFRWTVTTKLNTASPCVFVLFSHRVRTYNINNAQNWIQWEKLFLPRCWKAQTYIRKKMCGTFRSA